MKNFLKKLTSRKLWLAIAGVGTGLAIALGVEATEITTVVGAVTAVVSAVTYIVTEGKVDAESIKVAVESVQSAVEAFKEDGES